MGMHSRDLELLIELKKAGYLANTTSIIEIGAQQLSNDFLSSIDQLNTIEKMFGAKLPHNFPSSQSSEFVHGILEHQHTDALPAREFWTWLGFDYASIDVDGSPGSIPLDLNYDQVPKKRVSKYSLVTNFGTTEHIANQLNAFKVIHDLTKVGGIMLHHLPAQGMMNHGLINYNPKFFWMLSRSNGYKWLHVNYTSDATYYELPQNIVDNVKPFEASITERAKAYKVADSMVIVALQKTYDSPFVAPLDVPTGVNCDNAILRKRYWSIFNENPFDGFNQLASLRHRVWRFLKLLRMS